MTRIDPAEAVATLDHNLTELLGIQPPEEPAVAIVDGSARRRRVGLLIALPLSLLLAAITAGVFGPEGWLPAVPSSKTPIEASPPPQLAARESLPSIPSPPTASSMPTSRDGADLVGHDPVTLAGSQQIERSSGGQFSFQPRPAHVQRRSAGPTRLAEAEPKRRSRARAHDEVASNTGPDDPDGRLAAIDAIRMLRLR